MVKDDSRGIYLPCINNGRCNQCGVCLDVCPGHEVDFRGLNLAIFGKEPEDIPVGNCMNCYVGHSTDHEIRYNSSSGGLVTSLLLFALEANVIDGALVTSMSKDNPLEPATFIAKTAGEIISASGSKYCPVPANAALKEILKEKGKYAAVGLPCHIHGIRKAEMSSRKLQDRIALHIGIFCGVNIAFSGTQFQLKRMGIRKEKIERLDYRKEGWPGNLVVQLVNQSQLRKSYFEYFDSAFGSFVPWRCTLCGDQAGELADISFGDAWLPEVMKEDEVGTSLIITRNAQGDAILQQMLKKGRVQVKAIGTDKVKEAQAEFLWKKRDLKARYIIAKLIGRRVPLYSAGFLLQQQPPLRAYLSSCLFYFRRFLAFQRHKC